MVKEPYTAMTPEGAGDKRSSSVSHLNIFVAGATGRPGRLVVEQAIARGHGVTAVVRTPDSAECAAPTDFVREVA